MNNIQKKNEVQQKAIKAWRNAGMKGTCEMNTGSGKTFVFLHALYEQPEDWNIVHYFFAEVTDRKKDLKEQIDKYNKIFNRDVLGDYNLKFTTYQTAYKWKNKNIGLAGFDEIHFAATPEYSKLFYNNNFQAIIGLTATTDSDVYYESIKKTKGDIINDIAPICFTYSMSDAIQDGTTRQLNIYVINHELDAKNKTIKAGSSKKPFYQTEVKYYEFWDNFFKKAIKTEVNYDKKPNESEDSFIKRINKLEAEKNSKINIGMSKRSKFLYNLPSKIEPTKRLLHRLKGKTIIFSNGLESLLKITKNTISSRNSTSQNNAIREAFDKGKINTIGSFKKLEQGANLDELDNNIIMSYYSKQRALIQRAGRLRENGDKIGNLFIFVTKDTQEEIWFNKMIEGIDNLNLIYCNNIEDCLNKL